MRRALLLAGSLFLAGCGPDVDPPPRLEVAGVLSAAGSDGYRLALEPREFHFPRDHAPHPEFRHEWWYVTGNLADPSGRPFGFQITFFRFAVAPVQAAGESAWRTNQVWLAHLAVSDVAAREHHSDERMERGALGLAGGRLDPFRVWVEDWEIGGSPGFPWRVRAEAESIRMDLLIDPARPVVLQGDRGLSRKGGAPGNASYYYSITRLDTRGTLRIGSAIYDVTGFAWLDREWGTGALATNQEGWDWFALQIGNDRELMFYRLRRRDGTMDPMSRGVLVGGNGEVVPLAAADVLLEPLDTWKGPRRGEWPVRWRLRVPDQGIDWVVSAAFADQFVDLSFEYWEGSVAVFDVSGGAPIGRGYLEMTGYGDEAGTGRAPRTRAQ